MAYLVFFTEIIFLGAYDHYVIKNPPIFYSDNVWKAAWCGAILAGVIAGISSE